jgi:hypothetical protein
MDPTQTLIEIREKAKAIARRTATRGTGLELAEQFEDLDEWISRGGFPPEQWRPHSGRPRRTEDGFVLEGVVHGKRASYNKGCRCMKCTEANRVAGTRQRARAKERP